MIEGVHYEVKTIEKRQGKEVLKKNDIIPIIEKYHKENNHKRADVVYREIKEKYFLIGFYF